jgi:hypothetical protein
VRIKLKSSIFLTLTLMGAGGFPRTICKGL